MKKLIIGVSFIVLVTFMISKTTQTYATTTVTFDVASYFDDQNQTQNTVLNAAYGSTLSFENQLGTMSNYSFETWIINGF